MYTCMGSDTVHILGRRIQVEPVTFGSVPLKHAQDFEDNDTPTETPPDLASVLAQGCSNSMDLYPSAFSLAPKKQVDQHLMGYI